MGQGVAQWCYIALSPQAADIILSITGAVVPPLSKLDIFLIVIANNLHLQPSVVAERHVFRTIK